MAAAVRNGAGAEWHRRAASPARLHAIERCAARPQIADDGFTSAAESYYCQLADISSRTRRHRGFAGCLTVSGCVVNGCVVNGRVVDEEVVGRRGDSAESAELSERFEV
jgi:hypothetical protein